MALQLPVPTSPRPCAEAPTQDLWSKALLKLTPEQRDEIGKQLGDAAGSGQNLFDQLQILAQEKQALATAKAWKLRLSGRNYKLRDVVGNIVSWLARFRAVADVAVSFDPTHAALPWAAVRFILQVRHDRRRRDSICFSFGIPDNHCRQ
jgi:hypothetical protein